MKLLRRTWTLSHLRTWLPHMAPSSVFRLRGVLIHEKRGDLDSSKLCTLHLHSPIRGRVIIRETPADLSTLSEIALENVYGQIGSVVREAKTIIDLGANVGLSCRYFADLYPGSHIFAVEPDAGNYNILEANTRDLVRVGRFSSLQGGVWSRTVPLLLQKPDGADGFTTFQVSELDAGPVEGSVDGYSMEDILAQSGFDRIDLVKMDIEGSETAVFAGNLSWLDRTRALAVEFHGDSRTRSGFDTIMHERGFSIVEGNRHTTVAYRPTL